MTVPTNAIPPPPSDWDYRYGSHMGDHDRALRSGVFGHKDDHSIRTYRGHSVFQTLLRARFSPAVTTGERYIYTGSAADPHHSVIIYDVTTGDVVQMLNKHRGLVRDVSWNPAFPQIVSSSWDHTHIVWDMK